MQGRDAERQAVIVPQTMQGDVLTHEAQVSGPEVTVTEPEERGGIGGAERRLAVQAPEPLRPGLGLAPAGGLGLAAVDAGFGGDGATLQRDIDGLLLNKPGDKRLNVEDFGSRQLGEAGLDPLSFPHGE